MPTMTLLTADHLEPELRKKIDACKAELEGLGRVVVAFSAGADSTFLLALAVQSLGPDNVLAAMGVSASLPQRERQAGRELARQIGAELVEVETAELADPSYASNPTDRCFHCKSELFARLKRLAAERGFAAVATGANADDAGDFRPGLEAGRRLGVRSPLLAAGLTKGEIRGASRQMGLSTWDKPATACLASRVPYGSPVTAEVLERVELAEEFLRTFGLAQCRVRDHGPVARIEVPLDDMRLVMGLRKLIVLALQSAGYTFVALDLAGFCSGSMNRMLRRPTAGARPV